MARRKFLRSKWRTYSKLGRGRKKKQKYRRARGIHSKMGKKMKGNPRCVSIGFKKTEKGRITTRIIQNIKQLLEMKKGDKVILAKVGKKNKIEIAKKAKELGIEIINLNINKFFKKIERENQSKRKEQKNKTEAKSENKKEEKIERKKEDSEKIKNIGEKK